MTNMSQSQQAANPAPAQADPTQAANPTPAQAHPQTQAADATPAQADATLAQADPQTQAADPTPAQADPQSQAADPQSQAADATPAQATNNQGANEEDPNTRAPDSINTYDASYVYVTGLPLFMWGLNGRYTQQPNGAYRCDRTSYWGIPLRPTELAKDFAGQWVLQMDGFYTAYKGPLGDTPVGEWGPMAVHAVKPPFWKTM